MKPIKKTALWILICSLFSIAFPLNVAAEKAPHEIAGIALGTRVEEYPDIVQNNFLNEVVVTDWHGFRKGVISYGTCKHLDQILKIDMKYKDKSKKFFDELLERFRIKFGKPDSWSGDSFGVMHVWKWYFVDAERDRINLVLQYNGRDSNETIGNVVRLSYPDKIEEERLCFVEVCHNQKEKTDEKRREELSRSDWSHLVPR